MKLWVLLVFEIVVHVPNVVVDSQRTTAPTDVPGEKVKVPLLAPLQTGSIVAIAPVPIAVVGLTVITADCPVKVVLQLGEEAVVVIEVRVRVTVDVKAEVATVNVPEPVPVVVILPAPMLYVNCHPCPVDTLETVKLNELVDPEHIGEVTEFKVAEGFGLTLTVAELVKVELLHPLENTDVIVVSNV